MKRMQGLQRDLALAQLLHSVVAALVIRRGGRRGRGSGVNDCKLQHISGRVVSAAVVLIRCLFVIVIVIVGEVDFVHLQNLIPYRKSEGRKEEAEGKTGGEH
jgi:hypothetical protein